MGESIQNIVTVVIPTTPNRRERLHLCLDSVRDQSVQCRILIYESNTGGYIHAVLNAIRDTHGIVFVINDDMILDKYCVENLLKKYDNNLVYPDDGINNGTLATTYLCDAEFVKKYLHTGYHHNYCDTELHEIAKIQGKLVYAPEAKLEHRHWTVGFAKDETYAKNDGYLSVDRDLFLERKAHNFYL